jgi:hypothetical protein
MQQQTTGTILMIRPVCFHFNEQTAESNAFQQTEAAKQNKELTQTNALREFDEMTVQLQVLGVEVLVFEDTKEPFTPDSIFPNNWVSFHEDGNICLYPMQAENRRLERRMDIIDTLREKFEINEVIDFTDFEQENKFLEGTGSLVLDRINKIAYACLSPRTNLDVLAAWKTKMPDWQVINFGASDENNKEIYHTNVLMCVGDNFAVVCLESIKDKNQRLILKYMLEDGGKEVVEISMEQMNAFAGNMLLIKNDNDNKLLIMSSQAFKILDKKQVKTLEKYALIFHFDLTTIESNGGGSARCMIAEVHLPRKTKNL